MDKNAVLRANALAFATVSTHVPPAPSFFYLLYWAQPNSLGNLLPQCMSLCTAHKKQDTALCQCEYKRQSEVSECMIFELQAHTSLDSRQDLWSITWNASTPPWQLLSQPGNSRLKIYSTSAINSTNTSDARVTLNWRFIQR